MQVATPLSLETPAKSTGNESGPGKKCKASDGHAVSGNGKVDSTGEVGVHGQSQRFVLKSPPRFLFFCSHGKARYICLPEWDEHLQMKKY